MRPIFKILADSRDVTARIAERLIEMTITDEAGFKSDALTITVDDSDGLLEVPRKGARLEVHLGYQETGLAYMGEYVVDEPELSGPPDKIVFRARGADLRQNLKTSKTRSWDKVTLGDVVQTVAGEHELQAKIADVLSGTYIEHIDQTGESDLHFLTRLAKEYDAIAKPSGKNLLFAPRNQSKTVSGKDLPSLVLAKADVTTYRVVLADRSAIGHVIAYWQDKAKAQRVAVIIGDEAEPGKALRKTYPTPAEATAAATAELASLQRGKRDLSLTLPGNPLVIAESPITLSAGWRDGFAGDYIATRVEHRLGSGGFTTSITAN